MRVKYLAQQNNTMTRPGLEPGPLDPAESSALTIRPQGLPNCCVIFVVALFSVRQNMLCPLFGAVLVILWREETKAKEAGQRK